MLIDVLSDRGFSVAHSGEERVVPERVDLKTGEIESRVELVHKFRQVCCQRGRSRPSDTSLGQRQRQALGVHASDASLSAKERARVC